VNVFTYFDIPNYDMANLKSIPLEEYAAKCADLILFLSINSGSDWLIFSALCYIPSEFNVIIGNKCILLIYLACLKKDRPKFLNTDCRMLNARIIGEVIN
jgi:hypothetical protein